MNQASARYLGSLPPGEREVATTEINRFLRYFGPDSRLDSLRKLDVERYQQLLIDTGSDAAARVEPLKKFLTDLKTRKYTTDNLGAVLRVRRRGNAAAKAQREAATVVELTREGLDQLQSELTHLETVVGPSVREELAAAYQDRDFRENAPYDEAKRRMGEVQGQIDRLTKQIKASRVVERQVTTERAGLGSKVLLHDLEFDEDLEYTLVGPGEVDTRQGRISIQSPVGSAVKDMAVGDEVEVDIPTGKARYRVVRIESE